MTDKPKKPGAPQGNHNAYKHGFYSAHFKDRERALLAGLSPADLSGEIELMRVEARRFMQARAGLPDDLDFDTHMSALRAITLTVEAINSLLRTQFAIARSSQLADQRDLDKAFAALEAVDPYLDDDDDP